MITYQQEAWSKVAPEFDKLGVLNYVEADISGGKEAYDLDHESLRYLDEGGMVNITTARAWDVLVGYALSVVTPRHMQFKRKAAQYLGIYMLPEYRFGLAGLKLLREDEKALRAKGAEVIYGGFAQGKNLQVLFDRLGWQMAESTYVKWV